MSKQFIQQALCGALRAAASNTCTHQAAKKRVEQIMRHFNSNTQSSYLSAQFTSSSAPAFNSGVSPVSSSPGAAPLKVVVIGGVAGGASFSARLRRLHEHASIIVLERGGDVSYANCGIPFFIGGEIAERAKLLVQTPKQLEKTLRLDVRINTEAIKINRAQKTVTARSSDGSTYDLPYDKLLLSPGAAPIRPPFMNQLDDERVCTIRTLQDMDAIRVRLQSPLCRRVMIVGGGFIGVEMCEAASRLGKQVVLIDGAAHVLPMFDDEMVAGMEAEMKGKGVQLVLGQFIKNVHPHPNDLSVEFASGLQLDCDFVLLCIGVRPDTAIAAHADIALSHKGAIIVNQWQQTNDPDIYAVGDAVESDEGVLHSSRVNVALASPASRQARTAADHVMMGAQAKPYPGSLGTCIVRVFDFAVGMVGWSEKRLMAAHIDYRTMNVTAVHHAAFYPGAVPITVKLLWRPSDGKLLGAQVTGCEGVDKRVDVVATALRGNLTIDDLADLELAYAPPFGSSRDVLNIAGFAARNYNENISTPIHEIPTDGSVQLVDVRPLAVAQAAPYCIENHRVNVLNIPYDELRQRLHELDKSKPIITFCSVGKLAYFAMRLLVQCGFTRVRCHVGGMFLLQLGHVHVDSKLLPHNAINAPVNQTLRNAQAQGNQANNAPAAATSNSNSTPSTAPLEALRVDACGSSCTSTPLLQLRAALHELKPGQELLLLTHDAMCAHELLAMCIINGIEFISMDKNKGIITARVKKPQQ